jgi:DNA (cytosine-5)-methyltransferase 1
VKVTIRRLNTGRVLDLYSGIGGISLGFKEAGFKHITGMEIDPLAVTVYRARVGACWLGNLCPASHPPFMADVVTADIPWGTRSSRKTKSADMVPDVEVFTTFKLAVEALAKVVMIVAVPLGKTTILDLETHKFDSLRFIEETAAEAGYRTSTTIMDAADYGLPQHRKRVITLAFKGAELHKRFKWPQPTHTGQRRKEAPVAVKDTLDIDYPFPSPTVTSSEFKSSWKGDQGGTSIPRRASERIAGFVGRAKWGNRTVCLEPWELAALQGLPSWDWSQIPKRASLPLIGRAFPPLLARVLGSSIYSALYGKKVGQVG